MAIIKWPIMGKKKEEEGVFSGIITPHPDGIFQGLRDVRRKGVTTREFKKQCHLYTEGLEAKHEDFPVVCLINSVYEANKFAHYVKHCARRKSEFSQVPIVIASASLNNRLKECEKLERKHIKRHVDLSTVVFESRAQPPTSVGYSGSSLKNFMLPHAYMMVWTAIETYLDGRVRTKVFNEDNDSSLIDFVKKLPPDELPQKWSTGEKIHPWEYSEKLEYIVDQYLSSQPYHKFESFVRKIYNYCYGIDIMKCPDIGRLIELRKIRHKLSHEGILYYGGCVSSVDYKGVTEICQHALNLADYVEAEIKTVSSKNA
jgi:hypothetical protein